MSLATLRPIFLSASIPTRRPWDEASDPFEITDAVVAFTRAVLTGGGRIVTAAHPTIAPLILYVAAELPIEFIEAPVIVYQSEVFRDVLPSATVEMAERGLADMRYTPAVSGEPPDPVAAPGSLLLMRRQLLGEVQPSACVFVGGMEGIFDEYDLAISLVPDAPRFVLGAPGGAAAELAGAEQELVNGFAYGRVYPALMRRLVQYLES
ncbi:MAG: hypothetical protein AB7F65_09700 [Dehalococcoidia bacterium]